MWNRAAPIRARWGKGGSASHDRRGEGGMDVEGRKEVRTLKEGKEVRTAGAGRVWEGGREGEDLTSFIAQEDASLDIFKLFFAVLGRENI